MREQQFVRSIMPKILYFKIRIKYHTHIGQRNKYQYLRLMLEWVVVEATDIHLDLYQTQQNTTNLP